MRVLVPSYGRAGHASTMALIDCAEIVVPESQREAYEAAYPDRVISIPDADDGSIAKKRNALLSLVSENELFWMVDDDLQRVEWIKHGDVYNIDELLESHYVTMESGGFSFGGFSLSSDPVKYAEYQPFSLTKPSYGAVCVRNMPDVRYDISLGRHEDADYFLNTLAHGGLVFRDNRYFFHFECNKDVATTSQVGGIQGSEDDHQEALDKLIARWGSCIKIKGGKMNGIKTPRTGV